MSSSFFYGNFHVYMLQKLNRQLDEKPVNLNSTLWCYLNHLFFCFVFFSSFLTKKPVPVVHFCDVVSLMNRRLNAPVNYTLSEVVNLTKDQVCS